VNRLVPKLTQSLIIGSLVSLCGCNDVPVKGRATLTSVMHIFSAQYLIDIAVVGNSQTFDKNIENVENFENFVTPVKNFQSFSTGHRGIGNCRTPYASVGF
jgi:hypothetical protein